MNKKGAQGVFSAARSIGGVQNTIKSMSVLKKTVSLLLIGTALTACGQEKAGRDIEQEMTHDYTEDAVELVVFGVPGSSEAVWNERVGDALKKRFAAYTFTYIPTSKENNLPNRVAAGEPIDLILDSAGSAPSSLVPLGLEYDITDLVQKHHIDLNRIEPALIEGVRQLGGLYGFPVNSGGLVLYYNKDIFDKFGVAYPKDGMTWDAVIEISKKLTRFDNDRQYIGLASSPFHMLSMSSYSLPYVDAQTEKVALNNDSFKKLLETLILAPATAPGYKETVTELKRMPFNDDFSKHQNMAMYVMNFGLQNGADFDNLNWDMAALPVFKEKPGIGTQPYPDSYFLSKSSKHKDQAMEVLKYLISDEFQMEMSKKGIVPVLRSEKIKQAFAQETKYKDKNVMNALFFNAYAPPIVRTKYDLLISGLLNNHLLKVMTGEEDLNTALRKTEEDGNKAIEARK